MNQVMTKIINGKTINRLTHKSHQNYKKVSRALKSLSGVKKSSYLSNKGIG